MEAKRVQKGNYDPIEAGVHSAICVGVIDLGMQINTFNNKEQRRVKLQWETDETYDTDEGLKAGKIISRDYTLSLDEKATLCRHLESWRGKKFTEAELNGFDLKNILDKPCLLNITHTEKDGKSYADVSSVTPLMKDQAGLKRTRALVYFDMQQNKLDENETFSPEELKEIFDGYDGLPTWIQNIISKSSTFEKLKARYLGKKTPSELKPVEHGAGVCKVPFGVQGRIVKAQPQRV